jgi:hypothetical protein
MVSSSQIREQLFIYLARMISFEQFEDWFIPNIRDIRESNSQAAISLALAVEAAIAEYLSGVNSASEFRNELKGLLHRDSCDFQYSEPMVHTPRIEIKSGSIRAVYAKL